MKLQNVGYAFCSIKIHSGTLHCPGMDLAGTRDILFHSGQFGTPGHPIASFQLVKNSSDIYSSNVTFVYPASTQPPNLSSIQLVSTKPTVFSSIQLHLNQYVARMPCVNSAQFPASISMIDALFISVNITTEFLLAMCLQGGGYRPEGYWPGSFSPGVIGHGFFWSGLFSPGVIGHGGYFSRTFLSRGPTL